MDPNVQVEIEVKKTGSGADQAQAEINGLKTSSDSAAASVGRLGAVSYGLRTAIGGLGNIMRGGISAVHGFGQALAGVVAMLSSTVWGRILQIAGLVAMLGVTIVSKFRDSKKATDDLLDSVKRLDFGEKSSEWSQAMEAGEASARNIADAFGRTAKFADDTRRQMDELNDAVLASQLAQIDLQVAQGQRAPEQAQFERIELRRRYAADKSSREATDAEKRLKDIAKERAQHEQSISQATEAEAKARGEVLDKLTKPLTLATKDPLAEMAEISQAAQDPAKLAALLQKRAQEATPEFLGRTALTQEERQRAVEAAGAYDKYRGAASQLEGVKKVSVPRLQSLNDEERATRNRLVIANVQAQTLDAAAQTQRLEAQAKAKAAADAEAERQRAAQEQAAAERERIAKEAARARQDQAVGIAQGRVTLEKGDVSSAQLALAGAQRAAAARGAGKREDAALRSATSRLDAEYGDLGRAEAALKQAQQGNLDAINRLISLTGQALAEQRQQDRRIAQLESQQKTGARKTE